MNPCCSASGGLKEHPKCTAECNTLLSMRDSSYAKLKLEHQLLAKKLREVESANKALSTELKQSKSLVCTLQCEVQTLVDKYASDLATSCPYIEARLQPRSNETMLAELLRVQKAINARYKAKADTVDSLQRELASLKSKPSAAPKRHDMVVNFHVKERYRRDFLTPAEIDAQDKIHSMYYGSGSPSA